LTARNRNGRKALRREEMGTLGSGNRWLEHQQVTQVFDGE